MKPQKEILIIIRRLAGQFRTIIKKGWFSNLDILEIHQKMNIVIQYKIRQELTNKNNLTEMNNQLQKIETSHKQQHRANINTRTKSKSRKCKEDYERGKDYLIITKNGEQLRRKRKNKSSTILYINE